MQSDVSRLLCDSLTGDLVISAPARRFRPDATAVAKAKKSNKPKDPFSASALKKHEKVLAVYGRGNFKCTAVQNIYPVFHEDRELVGHQEILVEGGRLQPFSAFSVAQMEAVLKAMAERSKILRRNPKLKYMVVFKNEGREAGASQIHPHSQIFGVSFVPQRLKQLQARRRRQKNAFTKLLKEATAERIIYADKLVLAYADPVSRFGYGVRILLRRRIDNITQAKPAELLSIAKALHSFMPLIRKRGLAYNFYFHDIFADKNEIFEIRFAPRPNIWGGFEMDSGINVNPVPAEDAAREYREAIQS